MSPRNFAQLHDYLIKFHYTDFCSAEWVCNQALVASQVLWLQFVCVTTISSSPFRLSICIVMYATWTTITYTRSLQFSYAHEQKAHGQRVRIQGHI